MASGITKRKSLLDKIQLFEQIALAKQLKTLDVKVSTQKVEESKDQKPFQVVDDSKKEIQASSYVPDDLIPPKIKEPAETLPRDLYSVPIITPSSNHSTQLQTESNDQIGLYFDTTASIESLAYSSTEHPTASMEYNTDNDDVGTCYDNNGDSYQTNNMYIPGGIIKRPSKDKQHLIPPDPTKSKLQNCSNRFQCKLQSEVISTTGVRDWNSEYIKLMKQMKNPDIEIDDTRWTQLNRLAQEFVDTAMLYAKIIISEICLPNEFKTIQPTDIGGVAGGQKYVYQGIMFKFALDSQVPLLPLYSFDTYYLHISFNPIPDWQLFEGPPSFWMYGGSEGPNDLMALKAAKNELKGFEAYNTARVQGLYFPLLALIDYKGFRLTAISSLPIDKETLRYGSHDSGKSVHTDIPELNEKMKQAAQQLNLKGLKLIDTTSPAAHVTGLTGRSKKEIWGPGDIEGHLGWDGNYYVVDFGRVMPPEDPRGRGGGNSRMVFCSPLRMEFVRNYSKPLCSDAFTAWNSDERDEVRAQHNADVAEATEYLYSTLVPDFARVLDSQEFAFPDENSSKETMESVLDILSPRAVHTFKLNMRHLGFVRSHVTSAKMRKLLLTVCLTRVTKDNLKGMLRDRMRVAQVPSDEPFKEAIASFLNSFISTDELAAEFWGSQLKGFLEEKYGPEILSPEERQPNFSLRRSIDFPTFFTLLFSLTGIRLQENALKELLGNHQQFLFVPSDVCQIDERPKHFAFVYSSEGISLLLTAQKLPREAAKRQLDVALLRLKSAYASMPICPFVNVMLGRVFASLGDVNNDNSQKIQLFKKSYEKFHAAIQYYSEFKIAYKYWGETLERHSQIVPPEESEELLKESKEKASKGGMEAVCGYSK